MEPIEQFQWCLKFLRKMLKLISQDIFDENYRKGIRLYILAFLWAFTNFCYMMTAIDHDHYDLATRFISTGCFFAAGQVSYTFYISNRVCQIIII